MPRMSGSIGSGPAPPFLGVDGSRRGLRQQKPSSLPLRRLPSSPERSPRCTVRHLYHDWRSGFPRVFSILRPFFSFPLHGPQLAIGMVTRRSHLGRPLYRRTGTAQMLKKLIFSLGFAAIASGVSAAPLTLSVAGGE